MSDYPELPRLTIADFDAAAESYTEDRITALLPKIQECAKPKWKTPTLYIEWDLPKLRQVLKGGL